MVDSPTRRDGGRMTVVEHLTELRRRILISLVVVAVGGIVCFIAFETILGYMTGPYREVTGKRLIFTGALEGFSVRLKVGAYGGMGLGAPFTIFQIWRFVTPGLYENERRYAIGFLVASIVLFLMGAGLAIVTFPKALSFLLSIGGDSLEPFLTASSYLSLVSLMILAFGLAFEFPVLIVFLLLIRAVSTVKLRHWRRGAFVAILVVAAVITPSQDPITLLALGIPMYFLYEGAIVVGRLLGR
ncbi:MAG: twin-arginine translocase subunit TatC [Acidimicrobiia bacterium]